MKQSILILCAIAVAGCCALAFAMPADEPLCTIAFDADGGSLEAPESEHGEDGDVIILPPYSGVKGELRFDGWNDGIVTYQPGEEYLVTGDTVFTAVWVDCMFGISYELNGGANPDDAPSQYDSRTTTALPVPVRDGFVFLGWCTEPELENAIQSIPPGADADLVLYAAWEESEVGSRIVMEYAGTNTEYRYYGNVAIPLVNTVESGTLSFEYLFFDPVKGYYIRNTDTDEHGQSNSSCYWSNENSTLTWTVSEEIETISTKHFGEKACTVWTGTRPGCTEIQYIGAEDGILYRDELVQEYATGMMFNYSITRIERTYDLLRIESFDAAHQFSIEAYEDVGVSITGDENRVTGDDVVLTAACDDGITFRGWYDANGYLISRDASINLGMLLDDIEIHASSTAEYDVVKTIAPGGSKHKIAGNQPLSGTSWTVTRNESSASGTGDFIHLDEVGVYTIEYSGTSANGSTVHGRYNLIADGAYAFTWTHKGVMRTVEMDVNALDYIECKNDDIPRTIGDGSHLTGFVTPDAPWIDSLAHQFEIMSAGMSDLETLDLVLSYVQNIPYMLDSVSSDAEEYWKYPLETIVENNGDCEDTSILFCSIVKKMGYDTALMTLYADNVPTLYSNTVNHCVSLVKGIEGCEDKDDFDSYYFCETTAPGSSVGDVPWLYVQNDTVHPV